MTLPAGWEMVVGLEVHTELQTNTKMFCGCANAFGAAPNTQVCPVCLGLPGSLPVLNERAVELAMAIGFALNCTVAPSTFHRKNYFYPDMPKDFQISQYDLPINSNGWLDLSDGLRVGIERAHLEEDTGKSTHLGGSGRIHGADRSLVDYNRSGVPLVEIVSAPDIRTPEQARDYASELRAILIATGASDGRMEEGSMRIDANVSVRRSGDPFGTRCEIKNLNSLRSLERAIEYEALRQIELIEDGGVVRQETRHWDEGTGVTSTMRVKEEAEDYRYFREPDLVDLAPSHEWQARVRAVLPAMPRERRSALATLVGTPTAAQSVSIATVVDQNLDAYVVAATSAGLDASLAITRVANELAGVADLSRLSARTFVAALELEATGKLSATQAKTVIEVLIAEGGEPTDIAAARGFEQMDDGALGSMVDEIITANPDEWSRYKEGDDKLAQFFIGQMMKATQGKANGKAVVVELQRRR
jgi:aspartyl-tRNA(Asn)/glutamyl-tRNA(Gln) amidotransferase subunit B